MTSRKLIPPPSLVEVFQRRGEVRLTDAPATTEPTGALAPVIVLRAVGRPAPGASDADASRESDFGYPEPAAAAASGPAGFTAAPVSAVSRQSIYGTWGSAALAPVEVTAPTPRHLSVAPDPQASAGGHYGSIPRVAAQSVEAGLAAMGLRSTPARTGTGPQDPDPEVEAELDSSTEQHPIVEGSQWTNVAPLRPLVPPAPEPFDTATPTGSAGSPPSHAEPVNAPEPLHASATEPLHEPATEPLHEPATEPEPVLHDPQFAPVSRPSHPDPVADLATAPSPVEATRGVRFTPTAPPPSVAAPTAPPTVPVLEPVPKPAPTSLPPIPAYTPPAPAEPTFTLAPPLGPVRPAPASHTPLTPLTPPKPAVDPSAYEVSDSDLSEDPREILRAATQKAVDRLVRPEPTAPVPTTPVAPAPPPAAAPAPPPAAAPAPPPAAAPPPPAAAPAPPAAAPPVAAPPAGAPSGRPSIAELTRQVERAVNNAALAESYQREIAEKARELAVRILADSVAKAEHATERAAAERESMLTAARAEAEQIQSDAAAEAETVLSDALAEASRLVSDGRAEHDALVARAESQSKSIIARAELELGRRIRRIAELTDGITDVAEATLGRLASGTLTGTQLAQFITTLGTVTERALEQLDSEHAQGERAPSGLPADAADPSAHRGGEDWRPGA